MRLLISQTFQIGLNSFLVAQMNNCFDDKRVTPSLGTEILVVKFIVCNQI